MNHTETELIFDWLDSPMNIHFPNSCQFFGRTFALSPPTDDDQRTIGELDVDGPFGTKLFVRVYFEPCDESDVACPDKPHFGVYSDVELSWDAKCDPSFLEELDGTTLTGAQLSQMCQKNEQGILSFFADELSAFTSSPADKPKPASRVEPDSCEPIQG